MAASQAPSGVKTAGVPVGKVFFLDLFGNS